VSIKIIGAGDVELSAYLFDRPNDGSRVWITTKSVHAGVGLPGRSGKWTYSYWKQWQKSFKKSYGLEGTHFRRSVACNKKAAKTASNEGDDGDHSVVGHAAAVGLAEGPNPLRLLRKFCQG